MSPSVALNESQTGLFYKVYHPNRAHYAPGGKNLLQSINNDRFAANRHDNPHYPFADKDEWELVKWFTDASLTQQQIDAFLQLGYAKRNLLSLKSARDIRARIEMLPEVPRWQHQIINIPGGYRTKTPITLYWRNPLDVVKDLYRNPIFSSRLMPGHTFVGIVLASDKTPLTIGTGNREMHPVLLSLANIDAGVRMKATSRAFALIAYLPIVKFSDVTDHEQSILKARLYHWCLDIILQPLKIAERQGETMSDASGLLRVVHTPLAAWIADYPEQQLLACIAGNQSPVTTAFLQNFGDGTARPPRTRQLTLDAIKEVLQEHSTIPNVDAIRAGRALEPFWRACQQRGLSSVDSPFWSDWGDACPSAFLTHDPLHGLHKFFWDHIVKWAVNIMTGPELDARLKCIQPRVGVRHWAQGVSGLKQVTGREYRELEKVFIAAINGGVNPPVMCAMRSLVDFIFQSQNLLFYGETFHALSEALREFHWYKTAVIAAGGRLGKNGVINHFRIPKLEMLHIIGRSARLLGAPYQWTSDITERCHITHVKTPYRMSNRREHHSQCVRYMDRVEKMNVFGLFAALTSNEASLLNDIVTETNDMADHYPEQTWLSRVLPEEEAVSTKHFKARTNLFGKKTSIVSDDEMTAIYLNVKPHFKALSISTIANLYNLPDLRGALGDYFQKLSYLDRSGQRRSRADCSMPTSLFHVWQKFRIQHRSFQDSRIVAPHQTVEALPPDSTKLPFGRCNTVLVSGDNGDCTFAVSEGCRVIQIRIILQPVLSNASTDPPPYLVYGEFFKFATEHTSIDEAQANTSVYTPVPGIDMFQVNRHKRSNGSRMGDIVPLDRILQVVELVPKHGLHIDPSLDCDNSLEGDTFFLNNFSNKENFHAILSYQ
ncbi:hypothetical protein HYPSUDRAFT_145116 [Hypholoma sublateritium FD-334 SS-4]|uniref:DUF6830 domain-containing protein n=1 Tax=Hypholoma sublateritium (strain FD-334 SS-4) TaxID=945553 RepID=A0A0D2NNI5_HYPSF|nr:hypothetical protein HYPSUDRAFT_145116 [Hypholoma sublateritium FD-334 SS-4]